MKIKDLLTLLAIYLALFLLGTVFYVLTISLGMLDFIPVFFYKGLLAILIAGIIFSLAMVLLRRFVFKNLLVFRDILLFFCVFCCVHVVVFTHLPVTADRAVSVFMLGYMTQKGEACTMDELEDVFIEKYVKEYGAFDKRFFEQVYTGTIVEGEDGQYTITNSGKNIISIYKFVARLFKIDNKLIEPK